MNTINSISAQIQDSLVRVNCYSDSKQAVFTFWVPIASLDEYGQVPSAIIRARVKHGTKQNLGQFFYTKEYN